MSSRAGGTLLSTARSEDGPVKSGRRIARPLLALGLLAVAWLLPVAAQALRADWVLLLVLLLATASMLRAGYFLLDRLMFAGILLTGTLIAGGLLFSLWPWGLAPVPVTGTLLTVLVAVWLLTGRRPALPLRLQGTDAIIVGAGAIAAWIMLGPVAGRSVDYQLGYTTGSEDKYAHFALFDVIHRLSGYAFLSPGRAWTTVTSSTAHVYPQGSHYLYAVFDIFLRSAVNPGAAPAEFSRYVIYTLAAFGFLVAAVTWSARWVAGPAMAGWRLVLICSAVATLTATGPLTELVKFAFDSETIGLILLAMTIAVTARPAGRPREQVLLVAAALIAVWYCYNLYGALASLGVIAAAVVYRRRLRRHWRFAVVAAAVTVPVALLPSILAELSGFSATRQLTIGGDIIPLNWLLIVGVALLACAGLATRAGRRSGACRVTTAHVVLASVTIAALSLYQRQALGSTTQYYLAKALTGGYVICLVGSGAAVLLLDAVRKRISGAQPIVVASRLDLTANRAPGMRPGRTPARLRDSLAVGAAVVVLASGLLWALPGVRNGQPDYSQAWAFRWWSGQVKARPGAALQVLAQAHLLADGVPTLVLYKNAGLENWRVSFFDAVLNHDLGTMKTTFDPLLTAIPVMAGSEDLLTVLAIDHNISIIENAVEHGPHHIRIVVSGRRLAARLRFFARAHPGLDLTVRYLPRLSTAARHPARPPG
jgi:hypothetical protein